MNTILEESFNKSINDEKIHIVFYCEMIEKKLKIAIDALNEIIKTDENLDIIFDTNIAEIAKTALRKIK